MKVGDIVRINVDFAYGAVGQIIDIKASMSPLSFFNFLVEVGDTYPPTQLWCRGNELELVDLAKLRLESTLDDPSTEIDLHAEVSWLITSMINTTNKLSKMQAELGEAIEKLDRLEAKEAKANKLKEALQEMGDLEERSSSLRESYEELIRNAGVEMKIRRGICPDCGNFFCVTDKETRLWCPACVKWYLIPMENER